MFSAWIAINIVCPPCQGRKLSQLLPGAHIENSINAIPATHKFVVIPYFSTFQISPPTPNNQMCDHVCKFPEKYILTKPFTLKITYLYATDDVNSWNWRNWVMCCAKSLEIPQFNCLVRIGAPTAFINILILFWRVLSIKNQQQFHKDLNLWPCYFCYMCLENICFIPDNLKCAERHH